MRFICALALAGILAALSLQAQANSLLMPGEVIQGHAKVEEDCGKCHKRFDKAAQSGLCTDCHKNVGKDIADGRGFHGRIKPQKECKACHTEHKGRNAKIDAFNHARFDHNMTDYPLKGGHRKPTVKCTDCHKPGKKFREAPGLCNDCHKKDDKHKGGLGTNCSQCHIEKSWKTTRFDHSKTKFRLFGKHQDVKCSKCHIANKFKDTPMQCNACHRKEGDKAHRGKLGSKCESCHVATGWKVIRFDHDMRTHFPLLGKHRDVKCDKCHARNRFKDTPKLCNSCHRKEGFKAHKGKLGTKCESCHVESGWKKEIIFDHNSMSNFLLLGSHQLVACKKCHASATFKEAPSDCWSCHRKKDVHKRRFGTECQNCHNTRNWKAWDFDHDKTRFRLDGPHRKTAGKCYACHRQPMGRKVVLSTSCESCHDRDDVHDGEFGEHCDRCHIGNDWKHIRIGVIRMRMK